MKFVVMLILLRGTVLIAETAPLKTLSVVFDPPNGAVALDEAAIKKKFYKGNPPHVVYEISGAGSTFTIRESITSQKEVDLGLVGRQMIQTMGKTARDFELKAQGLQEEAGMTFFQFSFTDRSDNDLKVTRCIRVHLEGRTIVLVAYSIPNDFLALYQDRMTTAAKSVRFSKREEANQTPEPMPLKRHGSS